MVTCRWRDARIVMRYKAGIAAKSGASPRLVQRFSEVGKRDIQCRSLHMILPASAGQSFSHHAHLIEIANRAVGAAGFKLHRIELAPAIAA